MAGSGPAPADPGGAPAAALAALIRAAGWVVALTGAGISVPSGIPDFRSPGTGLWENLDPMAVAHIDVFRRDPERFWSFYGERFRRSRTSCPTERTGHWRRSSASGCSTR